jgi:hypothetical protein
LKVPSSMARLPVSMTAAVQCFAICFFATVGAYSSHLICYS